MRALLVCMLWLPMIARAEPTVLTDYLALPANVLPLTNDTPQARRAALTTIDAKHGYLEARLARDRDFEVALFLTANRRHVLGLAVHETCPQYDALRFFEVGSDGSAREVTEAVLPELDQKALAAAAKRLDAQAHERVDGELCGDDETTLRWKLPRKGTELVRVQYMSGKPVLKLPWDKAAGAFRAPEELTMLPANGLTRSWPSPVSRANVQ